MSAAVLIARLILGLGVASHGAQKLFGWFGGHGPAGTGAFMESLGFRPGAFFAVAAGLGELAGGILLAAGFLGGLGPALVIMVMLVAIVTVHLRNGFFASNNGIELPAMVIAGALALDFGGMGRYTVDRLLGPDIFTFGSIRLYLIAGAVIVALLTLAARHRDVLPQQTAKPSST
ncbi:MAG TPA: DoxX family protein [Candidatus Baltobacteraceae bacterium]|jgi:putative oxidoreductase|nr:DoxX family protein [Candidatus Baltobacteraceae bacterium]